MVMIPKYQCMKCAISGLFNRLEKTVENDSDRCEIVRKALSVIAEMDSGTPPVEISMEVNRIIKESTGVKDLFAKEKNKANLQMLKLYDENRYLLENCSYENFRKILQFSVASNIIDFGPRNHEIDFESALEKVSEKGFFIDHTEMLFDHISRVSEITVLLDNAGEAVMDKMLMEYIRRHFDVNVTAVVRGGPILNDLTMEDAVDIGIPEAVDNLISSKTASPGTLMGKISRETASALKNADIVISKGQGNFEGILGELQTDVYFVLMLKCKIIADIVPGGSVGDMVLMHEKTVWSDS